MAARNNAKYRWAEWFAKGAFTLLPSRDFSCETDVMRQQVWNAAAKYAPGRRVSVTPLPTGGLQVTVRERSRRSIRRFGGPPRKRAG